jgi:hypothetical protein
MRITRNKLYGSTVYINKADLFDFLWTQTTDKNPSLHTKLETILTAIDKNPGNPSPFTDSQYKWIFEKVQQHLFNVTDLKVEEEKE